MHSEASLVPRPCERRETAWYQLLRIRNRFRYISVTFTTCNNIQTKILIMPCTSHCSSRQNLFCANWRVLPELCTTNFTCTYLHKSTMVNDSKTSEQRTPWGRAFCPLLERLTSSRKFDRPWQIILEETTEMEQWPDAFQSCSQFTGQKTHSKNLLVSRRAGYKARC